VADLIVPCVADGFHAAHSTLGWRRALPGAGPRCEIVQARAA